MKDEDKSKSQLIDELQEMRNRVATLTRRGRKQTEASQRLAKVIFNKAPIGIWILGKDGEVLDVNEQGCANLGYTKVELCQMTVFDFAPGYTPKDWAAGTALLNKGGTRIVEAVHQRKTGELISILVIQNLMRFEGQEFRVAFVQDITERKRMEEMIIQSEKMLSVGGLAAGMAHEINNPLAGIVQTVQLMAQRFKAGANIPANQKAAETAGTTMESIEQFMVARDIPKMIEAIIRSGQRILEIVTNMLSFARKDDSGLSSYHLDKILDKTIDLAGTDYDLKKAYDFKRIKIIREYDNNLPAVPCQASKIQQVLLNILTNGAQAMQSADTQNARFILRTYADLTRNMACIEIKDNGPGMEEKIRKKVFDPFFTTKPEGVGTGLGLSVSYFIITESHKGTMEVLSEPGKGANFIIRLPIYRKN